MKKLFCRIGSKTSIRKIIIKQIPKHEIYVEPFAGGAAIYFALGKRDGVVEVLNDKEKELIEGYKLVKKAALATPADIKSLSKHLASNDTLTAFYKSSGGGDLEKLAKRIIQFCYTYSSKGVGKAYMAPEGHGSFLTKVKKLPLFKERMKDTKFYNWDYKRIIKKYDSDKTFFYIDPPYDNSETLYKHGAINYVELAEILGKIKGRFILSLNDNPEFKNIFKRFKIKKIKVKSSSHGNGGIGKDRVEFLIMN